MLVAAMLKIESLRDRDVLQTYASLERIYEGYAAAGYLERPPDVKLETFLVSQIGTWFR
jgi:hypothetical protein